MDLEVNFSRKTEVYSLMEFIPKEAPEELWESYFRLSENVFREFNQKYRLPDRLAVRRRFLAPNPLYRVRRWLLFDGADTVLAFASISFDTELSPDYESNKQICQVRILVIPSCRRKKIGSQLLNRLCETAGELGKSIVLAEADNPLAEEFCRHLEGAKVHEEVQHRLRMDDVDWQLVESWLEKGRTKTRNIGIEFFQDCPESDIEEFTRAYTEIINQRPTGDMQRELITTPESRRIEERNLKRRGIEWYTIITREHDEKISGMTDILYNQEEPYRINQYFTGVLAKYRRRELSKRLKAEMLVVIRDRFPQVEYIKTSTARKNFPMRSVNRKLGFFPHKTVFIYRWNLQDLRRRVEKILSGADRSPAKS
jgi:GNAT superfamily N-acetyltransferase